MPPLGLENDSAALNKVKILAHLGSYCWIYLPCESNSNKNLLWNCHGTAKPIRRRDTCAHINIHEYAKNMIKLPWNCVLVPSLENR